MIELQGPRGLGDALLVRIVAMEWLRRGREVRVHTAWPEVFQGLRATIEDAQPIGALTGPPLAGPGSTRG